MNAMDQRILSLIAEGKPKREVAEILKSEGFKTAQDKDITERWVASRHSFLRDRSATQSKKTMVTIPVAEKEEAKVVAIYGSVDAVSEMIRKWVSNG